jgi:hypothetical protein
MHPDPITPFELPDLRRLLVSGSHRARRLADGCIEIVPTDSTSDAPSYSLRTLEADDLPELAPPRRRRRPW